jgi:predicted transcriptional regulator
VNKFRKSEMTEGSKSKQGGRIAMTKQVQVETGRKVGRALELIDEITGMIGELHDLSGQLDDLVEEYRDALEDTKGDWLEALLLSSLESGLGIEHTKPNGEL